MSERIPWGRVLVEGVVIVGSILLAFGIEAGWQQSLESRSERLQLTDLAEDFEANVGLFEARQTTVEGTVRHQMQLLDLLRATPQGSEVQIPDSLARALRGVGTIDPVRGTLDALIGSGRLYQLTDPALRSALTEWPRLVSDVRTDQLEALQYLMRDLIPFLATQGDYSRIFEVGSPAESIRMRSTPALLTMISGKNVMDQWIVEDITPLVAATQAIHELLQAELEPSR